MPARPTSTTTSPTSPGRGPSVYGKINPDISAPGVDVVSSVPGGGYESFSGTSMAAPHTVGALALILSAKPALIGDPDNYAPATDGVRATAVDRIDMDCGGDADGDPNNVYGDGRIDAKAAVDLVATGGTLAGTVTNDANGRPIGGAQVTATGGFRDFTVTTDAAGHYEMFLAAGTLRRHRGGLRLRPQGRPRRRDRQGRDDDRRTSPSRPLPRFRITGHVRAAEDGSPLVRAQVLAIGTPVPAARTDRNGAYTPDPAHRDLHDPGVGRRLHGGGHRRRRGARRPGHHPRLQPWPEARRLRARLPPDPVRLGRRDDPDGAVRRRLRRPAPPAVPVRLLRHRLRPGLHLGQRLHQLPRAATCSTRSRCRSPSDRTAERGDLRRSGATCSSPTTARSRTRRWVRPGQRVFVLEFNDIGVRGTTATVDFEIKLLRGRRDHRHPLRRQPGEPG